MGCDIHPVCEIRKWDAWRLVGIPFDERQYGFFANLAGVRDGWNLTPLADHRGFPERYDYHEGFLWGDHSPSWCTLNELINFKEEGKITEVYETAPNAISNYFQKWIDFGNFMAEYHEVHQDDVRFVFNFDS